MTVISVNGSGGQREMSSTPSVVGGGSAATGFDRSILDGATKEETNRSFDNGKKAAFANYVAEHGKAADFVHFDDLREAVERVLGATR